MLTEKFKQELVGQMLAFIHAHVDGHIALIEAIHKESGKSVLLACLVRQQIIPPLIMGGEPSTTEQFVPIFQFVDPHAPNPYVSEDPDVAEVAPSSILVADPHAAARDALAATHQG